MVCLFFIFWELKNKKSQKYNLAKNILEQEIAEKILKMKLLQLN